MATSLKFRIEADNSSGLRGVSQFGRAVHDLGGDIQRHIGDKLKDVFKITFIEETVRRTAEWATELAKASKELGVSVESLQALKVAAERAGIEQGKIFDYFQKIEAGALKALNGNKKLAESFRQLGISSAELRKASTQDLMAKAMERGTTPAGKVALLDIFGPKEILNVQSLMTEMKGKTIEQYAEAHESQIVPSEQIKLIATAWINVLEDIKSIAVKLSPLVTTVLAIVDGVMKMVNGVFGTITGMIGDVAAGLGHMSTGDFKTGFTRMSRGGARTAYMGAGLAKGLTFGFFDPAIDKWMKPFGDWLAQQKGGIDLSEEGKREAEGAGEALANLGLFGTSAITKGIGAGARTVSSAAELIGAEGAATSAGKFASKMSGKAGGGLISRSKFLRRKFSQQATIEASALELKLERQLGLSFQDIRKAEDINALSDLLTEKMGFGTGKLAQQRLARYLREQTQGKISSVGQLYQFAHAGLTGFSEMEMSDLFGDLGGATPGSANRGTMLRNLGSAMGGAGSGALSVGGVYGVDIQSKLMSLNQTMVDLLQQIVVNTTPQFDGGGGNEEEGAGL